MPTSHKDHPTPVALGESLHTNPSFLEEGAEGERYSFVYGKLTGAKGSHAQRGFE